MKYRQKAEDTEYLKKRIAVSESYACEKVTSMEEWHVYCVLVLRVCVQYPIALFLLTQPSPLTLLLFSPNFHSFLPFFSLIVYFFSSFLPPHFPLVSPHFFLLSISFLCCSQTHLSPSFSSFFFALLLLPPGVEAAERPDGGDEGSPGTESHFTHGQSRECGRTAGGAGIHQSATRISQSG